MSEFNTLKQLVDKCKLSDHLPPETQKVMLKSKKEIFINILKSQSKYSLFMLFTISIFFWVKRAGITLSVAKSAIIVITLSAVTVFSVISGSYIAVKHFVLDKKEPFKIIKPESKVLVQPKIEKKVIRTNSESQTKKVIISYKLSVDPFDYEGLEKKDAQQIMFQIVKNLNIIKGKNTAKIRANAKNKSSSTKIMRGSIVKVDDTILITAKILNPRTSKVIFYVNEEAASLNKIDSACLRIAKKAAGKINW